MPVTDSFLQFVLEQLSACRREISHRRMFGGVGIYADERFVALIEDDRFYLKADDSNRPTLESQNAAQFRPFGDGSHSMSYYEVPVRVLEHRDELAEWIERSWVAAGRKKRRRSR